ncbi:hypothetical protein Tco_1525438 [Tanacetum coccineum]
MSGTIPPSPIPSSSGNNGNANSIENVFKLENANNNGTNNVTNDVVDEESLSSKDEGVPRVKAFMAIAEDEPAVGKTNARVNLENESLKDEIFDLKKVIEKWTSSKVSLDQLLTKQVPGNIGDNSPSETTHDVTSNAEFESDNQEPLPPLPKLSVESSVNTIKKAQAKTPSAPDSKPKKKADSSTEKLLLTLRKEVKGLKEQIKPSSNNSLCILQSRSSKSGKGKEKARFRPCPKVVFRDNSSGDIEGYGLVNCNGITFTRVAYVNGLKHNLISISQLCDANFKVLFTKTQRTIFNQNNEVVLIAPRIKDVYIIDMSSYNQDSNTCFFSKASHSVNWL